jgi:hypothetical protein
MIPRSRKELDNTRKKLQMLEEQYEATRGKPGGDEHVRELTLESLKKLIHQLKEEIVRCESRIISQSSDS